MSFLRHGKIYRSDEIFSDEKGRGRGTASRWSAPEPGQKTRRKERVWLIVRDEFPAGYSLAGCSPAEPASASPTALSMHWGRGAGNCLPANGNLSLVSVSQARGAVHRAVNGNVSSVPVFPPGFPPVFPPPRAISKVECPIAPSLSTPVENSLLERVGRASARDFLLRRTVVSRI